MRVLMVTHIGETLGHLVRGLAIADELAARGITVEVAAAGRAAELIKQRPSVAKHHRVRWEWSHNSCAPDVPSPVFLRRVSESVSDVLKVVKEVRPDLIIGMPGIVTTQLARYFHIPHVSILHGPYLSPLLSLDAPTPVESAVLDFAKKMCAGPANAVFEMLRERFGLPALDYQTYLRTESIIVPQRGLTFPPALNIYQTSFIRASLGPPFTHEAYDLTEACHITFGSGNPCELSRVVELAAAVFPSIIVTTGGIGLSRDLPDVIAEPFIASSSLAGRVAVVISHGGIGTVGTFAEFGTPQLIIPTELDQAVMAVLAERCGIAKSCGVAAWARTGRLGRKLPVFSDEEFMSALETLRDCSLTASLEPSSGAADIAAALARGERAKVAQDARETVLC